MLQDLGDDDVGRRVEEGVVVWEHQVDFERFERCGSERQWSRACLASVAMHEKKEREGRGDGLDEDRARSQWMA